MSKADISINVSNVRQADIKMCNSYTSLNYFIFEISKLFYVGLYLMPQLISNVLLFDFYSSDKLIIQNRFTYARCL